MYSNTSNIFTLAGKPQKIEQQMEAASKICKPKANVGYQYTQWK